ncbi:MAG: hypothetical protein JF589_07945 [Gemmatimonadetes bacterium]|nr:hypothetical protein [Gemmatimonadota bacterium]
MKNRILAGLTVAGVAILASCGQDLTQSTAVPAAPSLTRVVTPTCSYSTATNDARTYFSSNKDAVFTLLSTMSKLGTGAAANGAGWSVLGRLADAAGTAAVKGTAAQGSTFANDVLLCMAVSTYTYPLDLSGALGANGLFAVRDGSSAAPAISRGTSLYGAEPSTGNWPVAGSTLFYASPVTSSLFDNETPAGVVFDLKSLPGGLTFSPLLRVGVCSISDPNARILHDHTGNAVILSPDDALSFCSTASNATQSSNSLFAAAATLATWLAPQPAHAATTMFKLGGGGTGLVGGLSDIGPVSFTSVVTFTQTPNNTSVSTQPQQFTPTVTVTAITAKGHAIANVLITLTVASNNGSFNISGNTAYTDVNGVATFPSLRIDKAGGYTMTATTEVGGTASTFFNINGQ